MTTARLSGLNLPEYPTYLRMLFSTIFQIQYGYWLYTIPSLFIENIYHYTSLDMLKWGSILGVVIFIYLYSIVAKTKAIFPKASWMRLLTFLSFIIFILGYAIFITNANIGFSPTGIENRTAIAASVGVSLSIIGGIGWFSKIFYWERLSRLLFCAFIALVCMYGFISINSLASFWSSASQKQTRILSDIYNQVTQMPPHSTIILDGVCPYVGPASVFESQWDLKGALQTHYHDKTLQADIATPNLRINKDGISTKIYSFTENYPYKNLYIYNDAYKDFYPLTNEKIATYYFQMYNPNNKNACPAGAAGNGVTIY